MRNLDIRTESISRIKLSSLLILHQQSSRKTNRGVALILYL